MLGITVLVSARTIQAVNFDVPAARKATYLILSTLSAFFDTLGTGSENPRPSSIMGGFTTSHPALRVLGRRPDVSFQYRSSHG
jgi:hypothetical protein